MKLHHVICQKTAIFVAGHCEALEHEKFFRDVFIVYLKGLFLRSPEYKYCSTSSPPIRTDSEQINFDEVPIVKTKLSLCLGSTT
jgi:hypothetical protein